MSNGHYGSLLYYETLKLMYHRMVNQRQLLPASVRNKVKNFKTLGEIDNALNGSAIFVPKNIRAIQTPLPETKNIPKRYNVNAFLMSSLDTIGGGALQLKRSLLDYKRLGGSTNDILRYISSIKETSDFKSTHKFKYTPYDIAKELIDVEFLKSRTIMPYSEIMNSFTYSGSTSSGIVGKAIGLKKKSDAIVLDLLMYKIIYVSWAYNKKSNHSPVLTWSCASRPKLIKISGKDNKFKKILEGNPCSRLIAVGPAIEALLAFSLYHPFSSALKLRFKRTGLGIGIGCNRFGPDWINIGEKISASKYVFCCDYSKYDQRVSSMLMLRALDVIIEIMNLDDKFTNNYVSNYKDWFKKFITDKVYKVEGAGLFELSSGMPSGTIWTSTINSVVNVIVIKEVMEEIGIKAYDYVVYGDDNLILINEDLEDQVNFKESFTYHALTMFNFKIDLDTSLLSEPSNFFVTYERPIFKPGDYLSKGTRGLTPIRIEQSDFPFQDWNHDEGSTHRWNYCFSNRVRFLQYYWTKDFLPIRPMRESLMRIMHPEDQISNLGDHEILIISHLTDNFNNAHLRNWSFHLMYDLEFYKRFKIWGEEQVKHISDVKCMKHDINNGHPVRMWYRKLEDYVDLNKSAAMQTFLYKWRTILKLIEDIRSKGDDFEVYEVHKVVKSLLSNCNVSKVRASDWFEKKIISESAFNEYKYQKFLKTSNLTPTPIDSILFPVSTSLIPVMYFLLYGVIFNRPENSRHLRFTKDYLLLLNTLKIPDLDLILSETLNNPTFEGREFRTPCLIVLRK